MIRMRENLAFVHLLFIKQLKIKTVLAFRLQCLIVRLVGSIIENYSSYKVIIAGYAKLEKHHS